jgi:hypothetical protein
MAIEDDIATFTSGEFQDHIVISTVDWFSKTTSPRHPCEVPRVLAVTKSKMVQMAPS